MKSVGLISILMLSTLCHAQSQDTTVLRSFELIAPKASSNTGAVKINMPLNSSGSMADVLSQYSALFVKSYSPGNLASTSMRGMGAQHTAVLWNGINLQSCMNSNIDLNLLPVFFFDQAAIETGANASASANGAIAGAIYLTNDLNASNKTSIEAMLGSFQQKSMAVGHQLHYKKWSSNTRVLLRSAENDFKYVNYYLAEKPTERLKNSEFKQGGLMQEIQYAINKKHQIYFNYWYLETSRNLPNAMGITSNNNEHQDDYSHKIVAQHTAQLNSKTEIVNKLSYINENINYFNDLITPAYNSANNYIAESQCKLKLTPQFEFGASINYTFQQAQTDGYRAGKERHLFSLWTGIVWWSKNKLYKLSFGNRQLMANSEMTPSSPDLGAEIKLHPKLKLKANLAAGFRIPSFNDLFWQAGGNADLKPEISRKSELTSEYKSGEFKIATTVFYHHVSDWILWTPDPASQIWRASNAKTVNSRGAELAAEYKWTISKFQFIKFSGRYQFVRSINTSVYQSDSSAFLKQLFYTPLHTGFTQLNYQYRYFGFNIGANYTGSVFTTADNSLDNALPAYCVVNSSMSYLFKIQRHQALMSCSVFNIGNATYQVMQNRPMPLRNYQISIKFNINHD
jgi:iron complex outermembrane receptor protein